MANNTYSNTVSRRPLARAKESPVIKCPACGELECLCRPRFFAGQLLTEDDLNRLDHYIIEKNKLHNRYLHGWGVVCGLEVLCHPCPGEVTVKAGYALSPCGEDIIVCHDNRVNVCDLIKNCKDKEKRDYECEPFGTSRNDDACRDVTEDWFLAICYQEKPSRGITALRASTEAPCCSRCKCGGSSACGCSCHEQTNRSKKYAYGNPGKRTLPECEPSILCESYKYTVFKVPIKKPERKDETHPSALVQRFNECFNAIVECIGSPANNNLTTVHAWCCSVRDCLRELIATHPTYNCILSEKVDALCTDPQSAGNGTAYLNQVQQKLLPILEELIRDCLCSALLPPCPDPVENSCVVLAKITVQRHECKILRVCNWEGRKFAVTQPNLAYWLSLFPYGRLLREALTNACCPAPARDT